jgi:DNA-binding YbaB/EbfC family protein
MDMLRNPQAVQARFAELREKTERIRATGSAGGGMVKVTLSGSLEMISCEIAPEAALDAVLLQDLVRGAFNDAAAKVKEALQSELSGEGGLPFPPGMLGGL